MSNAANGPISKLDLTERQNARKIEVFGVLIAVIIVAISLVLFAAPKSSMFIAAGLLVPAVFIHELIHYSFQWLFSHERPRLGFKFPFPYSALAVGTRISRNQGVFCALTPFLFITLVLTLLSLYGDFIPKVIALFLMCFHVASCMGDFVVTGWLLKHPKDVELGTVGLSNALFRNEKD